MEYGRVIKRAIDVTWRHKSLWVFGIAAALFGARGGGRGGGGGRGLQYVFRGEDVELWRQRFPSFGWPPGEPWRWPQVPPFYWEELAPIIIGVLAIASVVGLVTFVVSIIVRYTSLGALMGMVNEIEETEETSLKSGLGIGWNRLLRLFAIDLIIGIATFLVVLVILILAALATIIVVVPVAFLTSSGDGLGALGIILAVGAGLALLLLLILVFVALSALVTLIREFGFRACVIDREGVFDALGAGIRLTRGRLREAILVWLLLLAINLALGLLAIPLAVLAAVGLIGPALAAYNLSQSIWAAILAASPAMLLIIVVSAFVGGVYLTFRSAVWTLTFRELRGGELLGEAL